MHFLHNEIICVYNLYIIYYLLFLLELLVDFFFDLYSLGLDVFFKAARHSNTTLKTVKPNFHANGFSLSISKHMCTKSSLKISIIFYVFRMFIIININNTLTMLILVEVLVL